MRTQFKIYLAVNKTQTNLAEKDDNRIYESIGIKISYKYSHSPVRKINHQRSLIQTGQSYFC